MGKSNPHVPIHGVLPPMALNFDFKKDLQNCTWWYTAVREFKA